MSSVLVTSLGKKENNAKLNYPFLPPQPNLNGPQINALHLYSNLLPDPQLYPHSELKAETWQMLLSLICRWEKVSPY